MTPKYIANKNHSHGKLVVHDDAEQGDEASIDCVMKHIYRKAKTKILCIINRS